MNIDRCHLYLTGYRGSGKTSIGKLLGAKLRRAVIDLDDCIEAKARMSIREIFEREGEAGFRDRETEALKTVSQEEASVVSLGGGAILREENRKLIAKTGKCIWLKVDAETVAKRLKRDASTASRRPSLTQLPLREEIEALLVAREPLYALASNLCINAVGRSQRTIANEILTAIHEPVATNEINVYRD
jgi:shikimate kinase